MYMRGETASPKTTLVWVDREGHSTPIIDVQGSFRAPRLSPDGKQAVVHISSEGTGSLRWVYDLERGTRRRLTTLEGANIYPVWTRDGKEVTFRSSSHGSNLYSMPVDGSGEPRVLLEREGVQDAGSWSPEKILAFTDTSSAAQFQVIASSGTRDESQERRQEEELWSKVGYESLRGGVS